MRGASQISSVRKTSTVSIVVISLGLLSAGASPLACSGANTGSGFGGDGGTGLGVGDGSSAGSLGGDGRAGGGGGNSAGCSDAAKLVYVVDSTNGLHSFDPSSLKFTTIGTLNCPTTGGGGATPNSMAVDRSGTAWVNFGDNELFKVSTADASCAATSYKPTSKKSQQRWGMAFSSNSSGSTDETLFAVPNDGSSNGTGLSSLNLTSLTLTTIGDFTDGLAGDSAELTGTGNGDLYGFVTTSPATLAKIDKTTGATATADQVPLTGVETGSAFAFSFWGGDFWLYTSQDAISSQVTQYRASGDKSINQVVADTGFAIVGAGVSTCAPTAPPR